MKPFSLICISILAVSAFSQKGLSLSDSQELALSRNPLIPAAQAKVDAAKAAATQLTAEFMPKLSLNGLVAAGNGSMMFTPQAAGMSFSFAPSDGIGAADLSLEWNVFSFGRAQSMRKSGQSSVSAAEAELRMTKLNVVHELRTAFAMASRVRDELEGLRASLAAAVELERVTNEKYQAGKIPQAYVFRANADRLGIERELAKKEAELQGALAAVAASLGADMTDVKVGEWDVPMDVPESFEKAMEAALANSPEIAVAAAEAAAYAFRAEAANRSLLPQITFSAMGDVLSKDVMGFSSGSQFNLLASIPIFDGGRRHAEAAQANSERRALEAQLQNAKNKLRVEVVTAWSQWAASEKVVAAGKAQVAAAEEAYRIARIRYDEGKSIQAELSQALADLEAARAANAESTEYKRIAWSNLRRATGQI